MHVVRSTSWLILCAGVWIGIAGSGCSAVPSSLAPTSSNPTVVASASSSTGALPAACFTVDVPAGWTSRTLPHCGLGLNGPNGAGVGISADTEPIDAATLHDLIAEKYSDVSVSEKTVNGERVLLGTGSLAGAMYIVVQARSATAGEPGYYAQGITSDAAQISEITRVLATLRTRSG